MAYSIEKVHYEIQTLVVHSNPGYHRDGVRPALGAATVSHSSFAGPLGLTDRDSSHDAYPHAHKGAHRYTDGDVYTHAYRGAHYPHTRCSVPRAPPPGANGPPR